MRHIYILLSFLGFATNSALAQNNEPLDRIVAVVNDHIILKSDVDSQVRAFVQMQRMPFSEELWYEVLESIVDNYVLVEQAKIDSVVVTEDEVNRALDQRIQMQISQFGSEEAMEEAYGKSVVQLRSEYRDQFREELLAQRVRSTKMDAIKITRPEVKEFFERIPRDSIPMIPESVELSQIVIVAPPAENARGAAVELITALRDSIINHGKDITELAKKYSDGPSGPNGGLLPMMPLSDLVGEYSAAASALEPGQISEVVETQFGFHVIRLNKRIGDQIETNHILIQLDKEMVDDQKAIDRLHEIRDSVITELVNFGDMARAYSEDEATAPMGGRILNPQTGEKRIPLTSLDPSLYRIVLLMDEEGEISEPKPFNTQGMISKKAYRIVRLNNLIEEHRANLDQDYDLIEKYALQQKQVRVLSSWIRDLRDDIYVEYKIKIPQS